MKKISFLLILFIGLSTVGFSQSKKALLKTQKKVTELVEKLNSEIKSGDESLQLSDEQKTKIATIHKERISAIKNLGKEASKEEKKKINKTYFKKIFTDVLTAKQLKARKEGKKKNKK